MKKILIFCIFTGIILIAAPLINTDINKKVSASTDAQHIITVSKAEDNSMQEYTVAYTLKYADESFCDEGIKAIMTVIRNNYMYNSENNIKDTIPQTQYSDEFYLRVKEIYKSVDTDIFLNGKRVYIPVSELSAGYTKYSDQYPYMPSVASPWDCEQENFVYGKNYQPGISAKGIDTLCQRGSDFKEALKWYLPLLDTGI